MSAVLRLFALWLVEAAIEGTAKAELRPAKEELCGKASLGSALYALARPPRPLLFSEPLVTVLLLLEDNDVEMIEETMASTVVVFATFSVGLFTSFSITLLLRRPLLFVSLLTSMEVEVMLEVRELERKEVDIVRVLRAGRVPKVVRDFEAVNGLFSTVVVSTPSSLMKVTLSLLDLMFSEETSEAEAGLLASSASLGT